MFIITLIVFLKNEDSLNQYLIKIQISNCILTELVDDIIFHVLNSVAV